ncbi:MAG: helix-turn-helix domain-containing protein [Janthinobacterium lividum]
MTAGTDNLTQVEMSRLGARLRDLRTGQGWTQDELARRSGLSKSYLSRIEDGERQPSLASLLSLSQAYSVPLASLFAEPAAEKRHCVVLRAGLMPPQQGNGLSYTPLSNLDHTAGMQPIRVTVSAQREGDEMYQHGGEEWLYVLSGTLRLALAEEEHILHSGDSAHFDAHVPHRLSALDGYDAELILVACAAPKMLLNSYF